MRLKIVRRVLIIRLVLSFLLDYWKIGRIEKRLHGEARAKEVEQIYILAGIRMRKTTSCLKGVLVKIGQFLSMRQDILPFAFTKELQDLHDALPPSPSKAIYRLLEKELGKPTDAVFKNFDEDAMGAASLAQVHKAVLMDGTVVAVKVIRPKMDKLAKADLATIGLAARIIQKIPVLRQKMNFIEMHKEFTDTILRELDCQQEINHMLRFQKMFAEDTRIKIPKVYEELSTANILVMEYMEGTKITDRGLQSNSKINPVVIGETLLDAYFQQILVHGFIHVDPHPGNLLVLQDGPVCFLDFGMVDELSANEIQTLRQLLQSVMFRNQDGILSAITDLGFVPNNVNFDELRPMISQILNRLDGAKESQSTPSFKGVVAGLQSFIQESPLQLQAKYMFLLRCLGILITVLNMIAPRTNWLDILLRIGPPIMSTSIKKD